MATPMNESENGVEMALINAAALAPKHEGFRTLKERGLCQMQSGGGKFIGRGTLCRQLEQMFNGCVLCVY